MKNKIIVLYVLLCIALPLNTFALEISKGKAYEEYENLDLYHNQIISTSDGGYIIFGLDTNDEGNVIGSHAIKMNSDGDIVKTNNQLGNNLKSIVEFKDTLFAFIVEYVAPIGNLSPPLGNVKIYKLDSDLNLGDLVYSNDDDNYIDEVYVSNDYIIGYSYQGKFSEQNPRCKIPGIYKFDYDGNNINKVDLTPDNYDNCSSLMMISIFTNMNKNYNKFTLSDLENLYVFDASDTSNYLLKYNPEDFDEIFDSTVLNNGNIVMYLSNIGVDENNDVYDKDYSLRMIDINGNVLRTVPEEEPIERIYPTNDGGLIYFSCNHFEDDVQCYIRKYDEELNPIDKIVIGKNENAKELYNGAGSIGITQLKNDDIVVSMVSNSGFELFNISETPTNKLVNLIFKDNKKVEEPSNDDVKVPDLGATNNDVLLLFFGGILALAGSTLIIKKYGNNS